MARAWRFSPWFVPTNLVKASPRVKMVAFTSVFGAYWLALPWMVTLWGMPSRVFAASYIVLAALLWGLKGGLLVALVNIPVVISLLKVLGIEYIGGVIAPIITLSLAAIVGQLTDLSLALEAQYGRSRQAEQALQTSQQYLEHVVQERTAALENRNAELARFIYTVSHDLKSPLITIQGFLGLLEQDALRGDRERLCTDLTYLRTAATTMQRLLDDLLALSRIGRVVQTPTVISLRALAHEAVMLVGGQIAARGVQVHIAPDLPDVRGDSPRLLEVLQNLVDNAVKFMGTQPAPRIDIGVRQDATERVYYVRDNGVGIDPRYHEQVFGLFERLAPEGEGTGIGLALVQRIIEVHGGRIWVESAGQGGGSTFCFTLALTQYETERAPREMHQSVARDAP
jgi:signal transduction histidine kinase